MPDGTVFCARLILIASLLSLTACLSTPPSSLVKLARLSPLEANPAEIRFAVRAPDAIRVRDGDITMRITFEALNPANSFIEEYHAIIEEIDRPAPGLPIAREDGTRTFIAALTPEDAASLAATQKRVRDLRAAGGKGKGSLAINATGCALTPLPSGAVRLSTWLQTAPADDFFIVSRNTDLRKAAERVGRDLDLIPPCEA
ncbi:MAG: hypothetical protein AAFP99_03030 [Pseudomonadota bacterium]